MRFLNFKRDTSYRKWQVIYEYYAVSHLDQDFFNISELSQKCDDRQKESIILFRIQWSWPVWCIRVTGVVRQHLRP